MKRSRLILLACLAGLSVTGGLLFAAWKLPHIVGKPEYAFRDRVTTNRSISPSDLDFVFNDTKGRTVDLKQFRGKKDVVLVVMRGFPGYVCPYCSTQTGRFIQHYQDFVKRDAELLIVYPGPAKHINDLPRLPAHKPIRNPTPSPFRFCCTKISKSSNGWGSQATSPNPPRSYWTGRAGSLRLRGFHPY